MQPAMDGWRMPAALSGPDGETMSDTTDTPREYLLDEGTRFTVLTRGVDTEGRHDLVEAVQVAGTTTPLHLHTRYDERVWVIEGEVVAWVGEQRFVVGAGRLLTIPRNVPHMIQAGRDGVRALNITSPAAFAELIERTGTPVELAGPHVALDLERFTAVSTALGDVLLGPPGTAPGQHAAATGSPTRLHGRAAPPPAAPPPSWDRPVMDG